MSPIKIVSSDSNSNNSDQDPLIVSEVCEDEYDTLEELKEIIGEEMIRQGGAYPWTKKSIYRSVILEETGKTAVFSNKFSLSKDCIQPPSVLTGFGLGLFTINPLEITLSNASPYKLFLDIDYKINNVFSQK